MGPLRTKREAWKGGLQGRTSPYPLSRSVPPSPENGMCIWVLWWCVKQSVGGNVNHLRIFTPKAIHTVQKSQQLSVQISLKMLSSNVLLIHHETNVGIWCYIVKTDIQAEICVASCRKCGTYCSAIQVNAHPAIMNFSVIHLISFHFILHSQIQKIEFLKSLFSIESLLLFCHTGLWHIGWWEGNATFRWSEAACRYCKGAS